MRGKTPEDIYSINYKRERTDGNLPPEDFEESTGITPTFVEEVVSDTGQQIEQHGWGDDVGTWIENFRANFASNFYKPQNRFSNLSGNTNEDSVKEK